jgi:hypothetical protein
MRSLYYPRIANQEDIEHSIELERDQDPTVSPVADGFAEAQIENKTEEDDIISHMPGGEAMHCYGHKDMNELRTRSGARGQHTDESIHTIEDTWDKRDEDGRHKPGHGRPNLAPDHHSDQCKHNVGRLVVESIFPSIQPD